MKRLFVFCLLALLTWEVMADYTPFVVEGKTWMMETTYYNATKVQPRTYVLSGDTIINNVLYKKLLIDGRYEGAYREEEQRVYAIWTGMTKEQLLYDFSLNVGDKYVKYDFYGNSQTYEVYLSDFLYNCGHNLQRIGMGFPADGESVSDYNWLNIWIEGVGSAWGPQSSIYFTMTGTGANIRYCRVDDDYLYKDTLQEFVSQNLSWADGYTKDGIICINRHNVTGMREVDGQTYTVMQAFPYMASPQGDVSEGQPVEYLLREDAEGEAWLRLENPQLMAKLYGITLDAETAYSLADHDLYLFNTRISGWGGVTYGRLMPSDGLTKIWQIEKANVTQSSFTALDNNNYTWRRSFSGDDIPQFLMSVGWLGYGPFYGFGDTAGGGRRFFPVLFEGDNIVYQDEESMEFLRTNAPSLMNIITNTKPVSFTAGQIATIVLPTEPDASKGKYYRLDRIDGNEIVFEQELHPQAHVPYIIVPNEDFSIELNAAELAGLKPDTVSIKGVRFIGTYMSEVLPSPGGDGGDSYYDIIDQTPDCSLSPSGETGMRAVVGALRAYLEVNPKTAGWDDPYTPGGTRAPRDDDEKMAIVLKDNPNDLQMVNGKSSNGKCYDLQGRRLNSLPLKGVERGGIYIENGRKVLR